MSKRVLMTGACAPGFPSLIDSIIDDYFVLGTDFKETISARRIPDSFEKTYNIVRLEDPTISEERKNIIIGKYCNEIKQLVRNYDIDVVVPIRTLDVAALSWIDPDITTIVPGSADTIDVLNNKLSLLAWCISLDISLPWFNMIDKDSWKKAYQLGFPFVVKPKRQSGSRGMRIVEGDDYPFAQYILFRKPSKCVRIDIQTLRSMLSEMPLIAMEYLPGVEYTVDCLAYKGKMIACVPRRRDELTGGISTQAVVVKDNNYDVMCEACSKIIRSLKLSYAVGFQFKCDNDGIPKLIECNPRLQGSTCLTVAAGLNIPKMCIDLACGEIDVEGIEVDIEWGTKFERTYMEWYE